MPAVDLQATRAALETERARVLREREETIVAPEQMTYGSQAAAASQVFAQQRDLALRDRADHQLVLVDEALGRLERGPTARAFGVAPRSRRSASRPCHGPPAVSIARASPRGSAERA